jgi:signal recognition particle subunit SRP54
MKRRQSHHVGQSHPPQRAEERRHRGKAEQFARKALAGEGFTLEDFREQLRQIKTMGSMKSILKMLPSVGPFAGLQEAADHVDKGQFNRVEAIINSMAAKERRNSAIINGSRRKRPPRSGVEVSEVNNLLRQQAQISQRFKAMGGGAGAGGGLAGLKAQQRMLSQMQWPRSW